jgi:hypothetical protein
MTIWAHAGPSVLAAFLGALVEFVEALTIVLAVGTVAGALRSSERPPGSRSSPVWSSCSAHCCRTLGSP